jgi:hypothetical protein
MKPLNSANRIIAEVQFAARWASGPLRVLPDFIIIGTQKGGTTSLYNYLAGHPCVIPAGRKEVHYFDTNFDKGLNWYRAWFPTAMYCDRISRQLQKPVLTGEASPYYLAYPYTAERVRQTVPDAKLIALLRNPIDRAYSNYQHERRRGTETLSFEEVIQQEPDRLGPEWKKIEQDEYYHSRSDRHFNYLRRGVYADQLPAWMERFPKEQLLILEHDDFNRDTPAIFRQVLDFLQLDHWEPPAYERFLQVPYSPMNPDTRRKLVEHFRPHNRRLYDMLGIDFGWDS